LPAPAARSISALIASSGPCRAADQALYQAKRTRSGYAVYTVGPHLVPSLINGDDFQDSSAVNHETVNLC
jgi:hypothetical protein